MSERAKVWPYANFDEYEKAIADLRAQLAAAQAAAAAHVTCEYDAVPCSVANGLLKELASKISAPVDSQ